MTRSWNSCCWRTWSLDVGSEANNTSSPASASTRKYFGLGTPPSGKIKGLKYSRLPGENMVNQRE